MGLAKEFLDLEGVGRRVLDHGGRRVELRSEPLLLILYLAFLLLGMDRVSRELRSERRYA